APRRTSSRTEPGFGPRRLEGSSGRPGLLFFGRRAILLDNGVQTGRVVFTGTARLGGGLGRWRTSGERGTIGSLRGRGRSSRRPSSGSRRRRRRGRASGTRPARCARRASRG